MKMIRNQGLLLLATLMALTVASFSQSGQPNEEKFTVKAGQYRLVPLLSNQDNTEFKISFEVANDRDIRVYVVDQANYLKLAQRRKYLVEYQSGAEKSGTIEVSLPRGTHYVLLDNRYASFYEKEVWLTYETKSADTSRSDVLEASRRLALQQIRGDMLQASLKQARAEHPASNFIGNGCFELAFTPAQSNPAQPQFVGVYRCLMKGSILGVSQFDFRVRIIGEVIYQNGTFIRNISSSQAIK